MNLKQYDGRQFEFMVIIPEDILRSYVEKILKELILTSDTNVKVLKF